MSSKNEVHPSTSVASLESHMKKDILILKEDIRGVDDAFAFILAFLAFVCLLTIDGTSYTTGLWTEMIQSRFNLDFLPLVLLPGSITIGIYHIIAPLADAIIKGKQRLRIRGATGALIAAIGSMATAFVTNYFVFLILFGVLVGIGFGLLFIPCIAVASSWFVKQKSYGIVISNSGTGFGIFIFSQFLPIIPEESKFRNYFIGISILCLICFLITFLFKKPEKFLDETIAEKTNKTQREIKSKMDIEEKLRMDNIILNNIKAMKDIQKTVSCCLFDNMILTVDNELVKVTTSTSDLYDKPCLTDEKIDQITEIVMKTFQSEKNAINQFDSQDLKEMVREYIQSKLFLNSASCTSLTNTLQMINEEKPEIQTKDNLKSSVATNIEIDSGISENILENDTRPTFTLSDSTTLPAQSLSNLSINNETTVISKNNLWKRPIFLLVILSTLMVGFQLLTPFYFIPLYLRSNSYNETDTSNIVSMMGIFNIFGRIFSEIYVEKISGKISFDDGLWFHNGGLFVGSLSILVLPFLINYYRLFGLFCCIHTMSIVFSNSIQSSMVLDYLGIDALTNTYTYTLITQGIGMTIGPPLYGLLFESTNKNFPIIFYTMSGLLFLSAFICSFIKCAYYFENRTTINPDDLEAYAAENPALSQTL